jgi:hypothetical protein
MTVKIKEYDRAIKELTRTAYPETQALIKVYGVGRRWLLPGPATATKPVW